MKNGKSRLRRKKETLAIVSLDESKGSIYDDTVKNFGQPFFKQRKNSDPILLHVPRNTASTSQVVMVADHRKISSNALNIIASLIRKSQGCVKNFVLTKMSTVPIEDKRT